MKKSLKALNSRSEQAEQSTTKINTGKGKVSNLSSRKKKKSEKKTEPKKCVRYQQVYQIFIIEVTEKELSVKS